MCCQSHCFSCDFYFYTLHDLAKADSCLVLLNRRREIMTPYESLTLDACMAAFERNLEIFEQIDEELWR